MNHAAAQTQKHPNKKNKAAEDTGRAGLLCVITSSSGSAEVGGRGGSGGGADLPQGDLDRAVALSHPGVGEENLGYICFISMCPNDEDPPLHLRRRRGGERSRSLAMKPRHAPPRRARPFPCHLPPSLLARRCLLAGFGYPRPALVRCILLKVMEANRTACCHRTASPSSADRATSTTADTTEPPQPRTGRGGRVQLSETDRRLLLRGERPRPHGAQPTNQMSEHAASFTTPQVVWGRSVRLLL